MKAQPVKLIYAVGYEPCAVEDATHVTLDIPGPTGLLTLPIILRGTRDGTNCWSWNGDIESPTIRPSVKTEGSNENGKFICHSWINDGHVQFLDDCSHELRNQTIPLNDVVASPINKQEPIA